MPDNFLQGAQIGLNLAQHWAAQSARQQELRVQEAYRMTQERRLAADAAETMQRTEILKRTAQEAVHKRAEAEAAQIAFTADVDMGMTTEAAALRNLLPWVAANDPNKVPDFLTDVARIKLVKEQTEASRALARERNAGANEIETEAWLGPGNAPGKTTAYDTNTRLYAETEKAVIEADNARHEAQTPEERAAAEAAYQEALINFKSKERLAPQAGSASNKQAVQTRIDQRTRSLNAAELKFEADMKEKGYTVTANPDGTKTLTPAARPPTTATVTDNQQKVMADEIATKTLSEAMEFVRTRPEAFGPQGKALAAAEKARSIASGGKTPMPVTEARQAATRNFITIADSIRVDSGNMNQKELALLEEAGNITGWLDDPGSSARKLDGLMRLKITQLKKRYDVLKTAPPDSLIASLPDRALAYAVHEGLLAKDRAEAEFNRRRKK